MLIDRAFVREKAITFLAVRTVSGILMPFEGFFVAELFAADRTEIETTVIGGLGL